MIRKKLKKDISVAPGGGGGGREGGDTGGQSLPLPVSWSPASCTFISQSVLLHSPIDKETQNTSLSFSCAFLSLFFPFVFCLAPLTYVF